MLIILQNTLHRSSIRVADSTQSREHRALTNTAGNEPLRKATSTKESTRGRIEEDIEQYDQDRPHRQSPPLEDRSEENPEMEPEMLLQPDTRPISHEQLVVEVKGIYAGLVMVEAKCIDIDERELAAAQERDPLKRVHLGTHQWQSLIALHKQVHPLPRTNRLTTYRPATADCSCPTVTPRTS